MIFQIKKMLSPRTQKFFSYYRPYIGRLSINLICAVLISATALLIPLIIRVITKEVLVDTRPETIAQIYWMGGLILLLIIINVIGHGVVDYQGHLMGAKMERDMRHELFAHLQTLSFDFYDSQKTGQLMSRLTHDTFHMSELYHHGPEDVVISFLNFSGAFFILLAINSRLAILLFLLLPIMIIFAIYFNRQMRRTMRQSKDRIGDVNAQIEDALAGIREVQAFGNERVERTKFERENERFLASRQEEYINETIFHDGIYFFTQILPLMVVLFGGIAIVQADLDLPDLITFLLYITILIEPIMRFSNFTRLYQEGITGFERFVELLEVKPTIENCPDPIALDRIDGSIEFRDVDFNYSSENQTVLRKINLKIEAGAYIAFVGESGAGKTTLCSLIPRFYEVVAGEVRIDGHDIRQLRIDTLREQVAIVRQDVFLFAGTVAENIGYGRVGASRAEIVAAAKEAHAHDFISALPDGYDTDIGQRGVKLSGGQKQRISIARAFLKDPQILIFDEATSALDNGSERAIQASLERLSKNRTTLVIAHRLSTIQNAERIVVLEKGRIVEEGRHADLLVRGGTYAELYNKTAKL